MRWLHKLGLRIRCLLTGHQWRYWLRNRCCERCARIDDDVRGEWVRR